MKISLNWLQDFIDLTEKDNEKIKEVITARSAEVETMENVGTSLTGIILGKVDELMPHPDADKLTLAMVNNGQEQIKVVCGGSNLKEGMKVAFAPVGTVVKWHGTDVMKLERVKIRGEESFGMICSSPEIGLEEMFPLKGDHEIVDLSHIDAPIGTPLAKALGLDDVVLDVDNHAITNRADLFSHRGFAREFVANGLGKWKKDVKTQDFASPNTPAPINIKIKDPALCPSYQAVYLTGIEVKESPEWMKKRLTACGIRPISNIVDITNYVMLELGMPMHAFDPDQVKGKEWIMRKSKKGEKVITLDGQEIELIDGVTVLDDGHEIFDLCGIMGGLHSGINKKTKRILLHAPVYNPSLTRWAVRGLNVISDAAIIYEKGVDKELAKDGLARSVELILELCPDTKVASEVIEFKDYKPENRVIKLHAKQIERLVGVAIPDRTTNKILTDLGFGSKKTKEGFEVSVPSWRLNDVNMEADVIEEVARIYSYDKIPFTMPCTSINPIPVNKRHALEKQIKEELTAFGFSEICTFSFLGPDLLKKCGMEVGNTSVEVANPISGDLSVMRQSLLPWTLEMVTDNLRYQKQFRLFEINRTYYKKGEDVEESTQLIMASVGEGFRDLQGIVEAVGITLKTSKSSAAYQHPGRIADLVFRGKNVGRLYELHPQIAKNFGIKTTIIVAEVDLETIHEMKIGQRPTFTELPKYPAIQLDVSILIPKKDSAEKFSNAIEKTDKTLVKKIELTDEYQGENIGKDKRSLTYSITYRSDKETLTDDQVNNIHQKVLANLKSAGAVIRD
ncbi:phenylalanine--tRNA ligase subunit beta [Patescibacteria group bacterium]|nr:phenylalanine--tRNA ligase subunit beta [Patescibacteria group bacterium]